MSSRGASPRSPFRDRRAYAKAALATLIAALFTAGAWLCTACSEARLEPESGHDYPAERQLLAPETARISSSTTRSYQIGVPTGAGALEIVVEQLGVDVEVRLFDLGGQIIAAADGPTGRHGAERLVLRPPSPGEYRVEIAALELAAQGSFRISAGWFRESLSPAIEAGLVATRAAALARERKPERRSESIELYRRALDLLPREGHARERGRLHHASAVQLRLAGELERAEEDLRAAAALWRSAGDHLGESRALNELGLVAWRRGDGERALEAYRAALALRQRLGDFHGQAQSANNIGLVHHSRGEPRVAREHYLRALDWAARAVAPSLEATLLNNLGGTAQDLGEPQQAVTFFERALEVHRRAGDASGEARALTNIGAACRALGAYETALSRYLQALEIARRSGEAAGEASLLNNVGVVYLALGDTDRARSYFDRALEAFRHAGDRRGEASALNNLGQARQESLEPELALAAYGRALELRRELEDRRGEAIALDHLGQVQLALGELGEAEAAFESALDLRRSITDPVRQARVVYHLAEVRRMQGRRAPARELLEAALEIQRRVRDLHGEAASLEALARLDRDEGSLEQARVRLEASLELSESLAARLAAPTLRAHFTAAGRRAYEAYIDLLMLLHRREPGLGWELRALEASERARARILLAELESLSAESSHPPTELEARRRRLIARLGAKTSLRTRLLARGAGDEADTVERELDEILTELDTLEAPRRRADASPREWIQPEPLEAREIRELLDPETVLLEYSLGEKRSFLWVVGRDFVDSFELPPQQEIENSARRLHELWSRLSPGEAAAEQHLAATLARSILEPAARYLGARRLVIVADGALHYLPFAALPDPLAEPSSPRPLIAEHQIVALPSASVLAAQRRRADDRRPRAAIDAAVLADPIFDVRDPRAPRPSAGARPAEIAPAEGFELQRLAESGREAAAIAAVTGADEIYLALGAAASRSLLVGGELPAARILHLATHGVLDDARPRLSGLMLSRIDAAGQPIEGFVGLADLYDLELETELVVLSGCRTALGQEVRGEGLLGLTRGFFNAGATRVLASLWQVQDRATSELMGHFYRSLLVEGRAPAEALATAQRALARDPRRRDPYHWAVFVLQGDWR